MKSNRTIYTVGTTAWLTLSSVACEQAAPRTVGADGEPWATVSESEPLPCAVEVHDGAVRLRSDSSAVPDPGNRSARDSYGRFFTTTFVQGQIAVWGDNGRFLGAIGRRGDGPGEFRGISALWVDPTDTVHVRDRNGWSVIDPAGRFQRRISGVTLGVFAEETRFVRGGIHILASNLAGNDSYYFHIVDRDGTPLKSFGAVPAADRSAASADRNSRMIAYEGDSTFWAGPVRDAEDGYTVEQWSITGRHIQTIQINTPWYGAKPLFDRHRLGAKVTSLHVDSTGVLLVYVHVPNKNYRERFGAGRDPNLWDVHYNVIDTRTATMLAAGKYARTLKVPQYFGRTRTGWIASSDTSDQVVHQIVRYKLVSNGKPDDRCR